MRFFLKSGGRWGFVGVTEGREECWWGFLRGGRGLGGGGEGWE